MTNLIKHFPEQEISFSVIATIHENSCSVEYKAYKIVSIGDAKNEFYYRDNEANIALAKPYLTGFVKWDGCSNWRFDEQEECMLHCCSRDGLNRFSKIMIICWDWTKELIPETFDGD
jgi:hypothetical protein